MQQAVIISATRTAIGKFQGSLKPFSAPQLGAIAVRAAIERAGLDASQIDEVIMGCVLQAGLGQNPARQAALGHTERAGAAPVLFPRRRQRRQRQRLAAARSRCRGAGAGDKFSHAGHAGSGAVHRLLTRGDSGRLAPYPGAAALSARHPGRGRPRGMERRIRPHIRPRRRTTGPIRLRPAVVRFQRPPRRRRAFARRGRGQGRLRSGSGPHLRRQGAGAGRRAVRLGPGRR